MIIPLTVPINVEGHFITEFEGAIEIHVTKMPSSGSYWSPATGAEWDIIKTYVDAGLYVKKSATARQVWISNYIPAPGTLSGYIEDYAQSDGAQEHIHDAIMEDSELT